MKGISAVIGALIILIITLALGGLAYTFIIGTATRQTAVILEVDPSTTACAGATNAITVGVKNSGSSPITLAAITISGTNSAGAAITSAACGAAGQVDAGGRATCSNTVTGSDGNNNIVLTGGGSSAAGVQFCS